MDASHVINRAAQRRTITRMQQDLTRRTFLTGYRPGIKYGLRAQKELEKPKPFPEYEHLHAPLSSWRDTTRRDFVRGTALKELARDPKWRQFELRRAILKGTVTLSALAASSLAFERKALAFARGGSASGLPPGFLPPGHWLAFQAPIPIYPLADTITSSYARHRWCYYDGVNAVPYGYFVGMEFGGWPYVVTAFSGPSWLSIGRVYNGPNYLYVNGTPTGSLSGVTVSYTLMDQQFNSYTYTHTLTADSMAPGSGGHFGFVAPGGSDTNNGTIGSPLKTMGVIGGAAGVFGATYGATTYPGAIFYARAGTYSMPGYTDGVFANPNFQFNASRKPAALLPFPGETATIDCSSAGTASSNGFVINTGDGPDLFLGALSCSGYQTTTNNYNGVYIVGAGAASNARITIQGLSWDGIGPGAQGTNIPSMVTSTGVTPTRQYLFLKNLLETNRVSGTPGNNYSGCCLYSQQYALVDGCQSIAASSSVDGAWYPKSDADHVQVRGCLANFAGCIHAFDFGQNQQSGESTNNSESCYNIGINVYEIWAPQGGSTGPLYVYRNNLKTGGNHLGLQTVTSLANTPGPWVFQANAIESTHTPVPNTGTEIQSSNNLVEASGLLNSDGTLASAYSSYLGTVGAQIA